MADLRAMSGSKSARRKVLVVLLLLAVLGLVAGGLAFYFIARKTGDFTVKPPSGGATVTFETATSRIGLLAEIPLPEITALLNQQVPVTFTGGGNGPDAGSVKIPVVNKKITVGTRYDYQVTRGSNFDVSVVDARTVRFSVPVNFQGHGGLRGDGAKLLSLDAKSFKGALTLVVDVVPALEADWKMNSKASVSYQWVSNPKVEIVGGVWVDVKDLIESKFNEEMKTVSQKATEAINRQDLKAKIAEVYGRRSFPISLPTKDKAFVNLLPEGVEFSGVTFDSNSLKLAAAITAKVEISSTPIPEQKLPLPALKPVTAQGNQVEIKVPIRCSYEQLIAVLEKQLVGVEIKGNTKLGDARVKVKAIDIYASGSSLVLGVEIDAHLPPRFMDARGFVYLTGTPKVEQGTIIRLENLQLTQTLDNSALSAAAALLRDQLNAAIAEKARYDVKGDIEKARMQLVEALKSHRITPGLQLVIENPDLQIGRIAVGDKEIAIEGLFKASAAIKPVAP